MENGVPVLWSTTKLEGKVAHNLNVDFTTVSRTIQLFELSGDVGKKQHPKCDLHHLKCLRKLDKFIILELVIEHPKYT